MVKAAALTDPPNQTNKSRARAAISSLSLAGFQLFRTFGAKIQAKKVWVTTSPGVSKPITRIGDSQAETINSKGDFFFQNHLPFPIHFLSFLLRNPFSKFFLFCFFFREDVSLPNDQRTNSNNLITSLYFVFFNFLFGCIRCLIFFHSSNCFFFFSCCSSCRGPKCS